MKRIVVTGSLAYDYVMTTSSLFADHFLPDKLQSINTSFFPHEFKREYGGTAGNISYNLSLLNTPSVLVGAVGNDFEPYQERLSNFKLIDLTAIKKYSDIHCATGFVLTDGAGNQIWSFYKGAMARSKAIPLTELVNPDDMVMCAPNDPDAMMNYVKILAKQQVPYIFDPAFNIPYYTSKDLQLGIEHAAILFGNDYELALIQKQLNCTFETLRLLCGTIICTQGEKGSVLYQQGSETKIKPVTVTKSIDPTGAGDAYRAGFLAGLRREYDLITCCQMGSLAGAIAVSQHGTQNHTFTKEEFEKKYQHHFGTALTLPDLISE